MSKSIPAALIATLLASSSVAAEDPAVEPPSATAAFGSVPDLKARDLYGKRFALSEALAEGPVVVTFWTTWCKPCRKEMPELGRLVDAYGEKGFQVIAVNGDGPVDQAKIRPYVQALGFDFVVILDPDGRIRKRFQVGAFPTTFLVDGEGRVVRTQVGYHNGDGKLLEQALQTLLEDAG